MSDIADVSEIVEAARKQHNENIRELMALREQWGRYNMAAEIIQEILHDQREALAPEEIVKHVWRRCLASCRKEYSCAKS